MFVKERMKNKEFMGKFQKKFAGMQMFYSGNVAHGSSSQQIVNKSKIKALGKSKGQTSVKDDVKATTKILACCVRNRGILSN